MKKSILTKLLSIFLATLMLVLSVVTVHASDSGKGKYVKDVFIAYGEDKETAEKWARPVPAAAGFRNT